MIALHLSRSGSLVLGLLVLATSASSHAGSVPPKTAPPYTGVYRVSMQSRERAQDDWTYKTNDTVTIAVFGTKLARWDYRSDGHTILNDYVGRYSTTFGGSMPPGVARRAQAPTPPLAWELGYAAVAAATERDPEIVGKATIAGRECTKLRYVSDQYGEPEFCVTDTGIVLRFANRSSTAEATYEAESIDEKAPDQSRYAIPAGVTVEDPTPPKKALDLGLAPPKAR